MSDSDSDDINSSIVETSDEEETGIDFGSVSDESNGEFTRSFGNITVTVVKDDITNQKVDVIINSTIKTLDLKEGAASRAILKKGGKSIQKECNDKYRDGINPGDIAVTTGGSLQCKKIYHTCIPQWNSGDNKMVPQKVLQKCLLEATKSNYTSVSCPALGTGNLNYDKDIVAKTLFEGVEKFSMNNPASSVTDVRFVIYTSDLATLDAFNKAGNKKKNTDTSARDVCTVKLANMRVYLKVGQLDQSDVLVTTSTRGLDLSRGTLSKSLSERAGPALQAECVSKYPKGIQHGEIAVLGPANINCKNIYCGALPRFDKAQDGADPKKVLTQLVTVCLEQANGDSMKSISFPTLGTGYLMYPAKSAANFMLNAISDFSAKNPSSTLTTVNIVILSLTSTVQKNLQPFKDECESFRPNTMPRPPRPKTGLAEFFNPNPNAMPHNPARPKSGVPVLPPLPSLLRSREARDLKDFSSKMSKRLPVPATRRRKTPSTYLRDDNEASSDTVPERGTPEFCLHMYSEVIHPPTDWTVFTSETHVKQWKINMKGKPVYSRVKVDQTTFRIIEQLVHKTWEPSKLGHGRDAEGLGDLDFKTLKITNIERLENLTLFEMYCQKRQQLFHTAGEGDKFESLSSMPNVQHGCSNVEKCLASEWKSKLYHEVNEGYFFHGTKKESMDAVTKQGIDPRLAQGGAVLGQAIYMAESSTKADQYTDPRNDRRQKGLQMLLVRASLGKICLMKNVQKLRRPPCCEGCQKDDCDHESRYHSVVSEGSFIFREFVVYENNQVYPEYIITYDRV